VIVLAAVLACTVKEDDELSLSASISEASRFEAVEAGEMKRDLY